MKKKLYYFLIIALLVYSAVLFYWMLFGFNRQVLSSYHFNFIPFATMKRFLAASSVSHSSRIINLLGNIIVFIPFGLCLPFLFPRKKLYPVLLTFLFIFAVESLQLILRRGAFDIDDFILNAVGYGAGYFLYCFLQRFENPFKITEESDFLSGKVVRVLKAVCIAGLASGAVFLVFVVVVLGLVFAGHFRHKLLFGLVLHHSHPLVSVRRQRESNYHPKHHHWFQSSRSVSGRTTQNFPRWAVGIRGLWGIRNSGADSSGPPPYSPQWQWVLAYSNRAAARRGA